MKKIALLSMPYLPRIGGLQMVTHELAKQYAVRGFEVHIITGDIETDSSDNLIKNILIHRKHLLFTHREEFPTPLKLLNHAVYNIRAFVALFQLKPDYVHCQTPYPSPAAWLIFKLFKTPYSIGYHAEIKTQIGIMLTPNLSKHWKYLPYIINAHNRFVLTDDMKEELESGDISSTVIPNGVDTDLYHPLSKNLMTFKTKPTLICVGRLVESKAIDDAIQVISKLSEKYPEIRLIIVGDGPERNNLETLTNSLNLQYRVSFIGKIKPEAVCTYYQESHVFLQMSVSEGFSQVVVEAMACGLPIISTDVGIAPKLIKSARCGYLIELHDIDTAVRKVEQILDLSDEEYGKICARSRECALDYSWDEIADEYIKAYDINP